MSGKLRSVHLFKSFDSYSLCFHSSPVEVTLFHRCNLNCYPHHPSPWPSHSCLSLSHNSPHSLPLCIIFLFLFFVSFTTLAHLSLYLYLSLSDTLFSILPFLNPSFLFPLFPLHHLLIFVFISPFAHLRFYLTFCPSSFLSHFWFI